MKPSRAAALAAILVAVVPGTACSGGQERGMVKPTSTEPADGKPQGSASKPLDVGDDVALDGNNDAEKVTVTLVKVADPVKVLETTTRAGGDVRFVGVQFKLDNVGKAEYRDSPINSARLFDSRGQRFAPDLAPQRIEGDRLFPAVVRLATGTSAQGSIVFQLPKSLKVQKVQFGTNSGYGEMAEWKVSSP